MTNKTSFNIINEGASVSSVASRTSRSGRINDEVDETTSKIHHFNIDNFSPNVQLLILSGGVFFFFGIHNILQEGMVKIEGFKYGVMLGYLEVVGVVVCAYFERYWIVKETGRVAPLSAYPLLTFCLLASTALSNMSLDYVNFPTKVVFRTCKLVPTMMVATCLHKKFFNGVEYLCALAACLGIAIFATADYKMESKFSPFGLLLLILSICADAVLPNGQERVFKMGASRLEVMLYVNIYTLICMTITTSLSGDLVGIIRHAVRDRKLAIYMTIYTFIAYIAISFHMAIVKKFGGVTAVTVATARKGLTLILSFILFPKPFSWYYVLGAGLVLGGVMVASIHKINKKKIAAGAAAAVINDEENAETKNLLNKNNR